MRYDNLVTKLKAAVFDSPARTPAALRRAAADGRLSELPDAMRDYVAKVAANAWKVTDEDVEALKRAGYSEDEIFEVTGAAAVGAALKRLDIGMRVLRESAP